MNYAKHYFNITERHDVEYASTIKEIADNYFDYLKKNKNLLMSRYYNDGHGIYIQYIHIDPKTIYRDLWIGLTYKKEKLFSKTNPQLNIVNNSALEKFDVDGTLHYAITLYILDDQFDIDSVIDLVSESPIWNKALYHELTHYIDIIKQATYKNSLGKNYDFDFGDENTKNVIANLKRYHNLSDEINAHFIQTATVILKHDIGHVTLENFKKMFIHFYGDSEFESLTKENKQKVLKRIYLFYIDLKEKKLNQKEPNNL